MPMLALSILLSVGGLSGRVSVDFVDTSIYTVTNGGWNFDPRRFRRKGRR